MEKEIGKEMWKEIEKNIEIESDRDRWIYGWMDG
jgi:hypothetical protein